MAVADLWAPDLVLAAGLAVACIAATSLLIDLPAPAGVSPSAAWIPLP